MVTKEFAKFLNDLNKYIEERKDELVKEISSFYKDEEFDIMQYPSTSPGSMGRRVSQFYSCTIRKLFKRGKSRTCSLRFNF